MKRLPLFIPLLVLFAGLCIAWGESLERGYEVVLSKEDVRGYEQFRNGLKGDFEDFNTEQLIVRVDAAEVAELLSLKTSPKWRHPDNKVPLAAVLTLRDSDKKLPDSYQLFYEKEHSLPIFSLLTDPAGLVDQEKGILSMGNGIITAPEVILSRFERDPKWWKYPGNYHHRGKAWEREGVLQVSNLYGRFDASEDYETKVRIRVNGNNTRGFPDKALRLYLGDDSLGYKRVLLRAAGNDHDRMVMRDALQHNSCKNLGFDVMEAEPVVLYINGVYWGIKYLRPRMDEVEIARRHDLKKKEITILEDMAELYRGNGGEVRRFWHMIDSLESLVSKESKLIQYADSLIDVPNFLNYMSAQIIFGNKDWPFQNLKYWRFTAKYDVDSPKADRRWRFIMGDSDLALGYDGPESIHYNMFQHVQNNGGAIARIFKAMMSSPQLRNQFGVILESQLNKELSATAMEKNIVAAQGALQREMNFHISRWHRPATLSVWQEEIEQGKQFVRERPRVVLEQFNQFESTLR